MVEVYIGTFTRWIFTSLVILTSLQYCESILIWTKKPPNTMILVVGVNNTNQTLSWLFSDVGITLQNVQFQRSKPGGAGLVTLARRLPNTGFSYVKDEYKKEYIARLENELVLLNVNNDEEFVYKILVTYVEGAKLDVLEDVIQVIVKVPPRIIVFRERQSRVSIGSNLTLTCNASGDPHPNITWTKQGATAAQFNATTGVLLHLVNVQRQDVGSYNCTADNGYGTPATNLAVVNVQCPPGQCQTQTVGITINDNQNWPWKSAYNNRLSIEFRMLESNLTSAVASIYAENLAKELYELAVILFRSGSIVVHLQLRFGNTVVDPLKPLRDQVGRGRLGPFPVDTRLVLNPTTPPPTTPTATTPTRKTGEPSVGARGGGSGLSDGAMWGIIGACIAVVIIVVIIIIVFCCLRKRKGGASSEGKLKYSEADGYRMNRQPPPSGLGTASPAYVEARMYAPANATSRQDDKPPPFNYAELSHDNTSSKPPPPRYSTEYSEVLPEKRPQQGEGGGFELWC